jgi:hypothetical protein
VSIICNGFSWEGFTEWDTVQHITGIFLNPYMEIVWIFAGNSMEIQFSYKLQFPYYGIILNNSSVCIVGSGNTNKLSLVGMQLPEKYKENFDVSSEGPSSGVSIAGVGKIT